MFRATSSDVEAHYVVTKPPHRSSPFPTRSSYNSHDRVADHIASLFHSNYLRLCNLAWSGPQSYDLANGRLWGCCAVLIFSERREAITPVMLVITPVVRGRRIPYVVHGWGVKRTVVPGHRLAETDRLNERCGTWID